MAQVEIGGINNVSFQCLPSQAIRFSVVCEFADICHTAVAQNSLRDSVLSLKPPINSCR